MEDFDIDDFFDNSNLKNRLKFDIYKSASELLEVNIIPKSGETIIAISPAGGWSSCSVVLAISETLNIKEMWITTLRVGKKELQALVDINVPLVHFALGGIALENSEKYNYNEFLNSVCVDRGWSIKYVRNHSKVILLDCGKSKIVIETSSNFNENPQIEQFNIKNSKKVFDFYLNCFKRLEIF